ncbi:hypothetical protein [Fluviicola taffensis]|uniref:Outer membrane protein beta-barrel domain-containing protein n=1 Tax=Fluviicola taffensis (strain DSM 16823 / NCIMB 13979 / RW262) TaxID=755732 RepID=F2IDW5_FLUTR|nr:hypothetical protein [Fluviicola taffensis]AEA44507.1 hypothetical protein Fluta_2522 [Fluviicola taffensis DSM 16823]
MKKDKNHIDKLFNDSLNQRSFDIPEAFLEDLNQRLDTSKRKRRIFFWLFTGLLCITGVSLVIFFSLQSPSFPLSSSKQFTQPTNYKFSQSYTAINPESGFGKISLSITEGKMTIFDTTTEKADCISTATIQTKKQAVEKQVQIGLYVQKYIQSKISKNNVNGQIVDAGNPDSQVPVSLNDLNKTSDKSISGNTTVNPKDDVKDSAGTESNSTIVSKMEKDSTLVFNHADTTFNPLTTSNEDSDDETKNKPNNNWRKEIQLYGGLGANFIKDVSTNKTYLDKLSENQSSILTASFGVNGNLSYKNFTFGSGLSYAQSGEKNSLDINKYYLKDSTVSEHIIDTILVLDSLGNWVQEIHDTTINHNYQFQDSTSQRTSFKNTYSWISIPIHFGYRFELGNYELIPRFGAQFNFGIAKNRGNFPNGDFTEIMEYQAVRFNISYLIQLEVRRNFNRWHIFINPTFKSMINPAISNDLLKRRYSSWGIQFGVGLKL